LNEEISTTSSQTVKEKQEYANRILAFFSGDNMFGEKIMPIKDFYRMMHYTDYLIEHEKLPSSIKPIPKIKLPNQWIIYEYYRMHEKLYDKKRREYFY